MSAQSEAGSGIGVTAISRDNIEQCLAVCPGYCLGLFRRFCGSEWFVGFMLESAGDVVGLVFGLGNHTSAFWLKVLHIIPEFSSSEYAQLLLSKLAEELRGRDYSKIYAYFTKHEGEPANILEEEYALFGFEAATIYKKVYKLPYFGLEKTGLLRLELPEWAEVVRYSELDTSNWERLRSGVVQFSEDLSPFVSEYDPETSIFLLKNGEVVGWNIARRVTENTVYFLTLFVVEEYRASPVGIQLLAESLRIYLENPENQYGLFGARPDNKELYRFIEKRFGRHCSDIAVDYEVVYQL